MPHVKRRFNVALSPSRRRRRAGQPFRKKSAILNSRKAVAERQAEDAERAAADAAQLAANRDRALNELRDAQVEASKQRADADLLKNQIATLRAEEASLRKAIAVRSEDIKALDQQRSERETAYLALKSQHNDLIGKAETARKEANDAAMLKADGEAAFRELQARRQELAKVQVELESPDRPRACSWLTRQPRKRPWPRDPRLKAPCLRRRVSFKPYRTKSPKRELVSRKLRRGVQRQLR